MITADLGQEGVRVLLRSTINSTCPAFPPLMSPGSRQHRLTSACSPARSYPAGRRIPSVVAVIKLYLPCPPQPEVPPHFEAPPLHDLSQHCLTYPTLLLLQPTASLFNTALPLPLFHLIYLVLPRPALLRPTVYRLTAVLYNSPCLGLPK